VDTGLEIIPGTDGETSTQVTPPPRRSPVTRAAPPVRHIPHAQHAQAHTAGAHRTPKVDLGCAPGQAGVLHGVLSSRSSLSQATALSWPLQPACTPLEAAPKVPGCNFPPHHRLPPPQGLDGLGERCKRYYQQGARFAKWRAVLKVRPAASMSSACLARPAVLSAPPAGTGPSAADPPHRLRVPGQLRPRTEKAAPVLPLLDLLLSVLRPTHQHLKPLLMMIFLGPT
jgi:hypothetical protein